MPENPDPRRLAAEKRLAREQRIRDLRRRVVAVAVALFVAVWSGLYIQLVSGHDPALAAEAAPVTQAATDDTSDDAWSDGSTDDTASDDGWSDGDTSTDESATDTWSDDTASTESQTSSSEHAAVTTGQS